MAALRLIRRPPETTDLSDANAELFEELKPIVPNFSLRMSNLTAAVIRPQLNTLEERIGEYNKRYD